MTAVTSREPGAALERVRRARRVLVTSHTSPDGDALGSELALLELLDHLGVDALVVNRDPGPSTLDHLPGLERVVVRGELPGDFPHGFDLVVTVECPDLERPGFDGLDRAPILNIDHHATNLQFGALNWVHPTAAATAQLLVLLVDALDVAIDAEIATCLLTGLVADTLGFRTASTSPEVMQTALELMRAGARLDRVMDHVFNHRSVSMMRMWALALTRMRLDGPILWSEITQDIRAQAAYVEDGDAGLVSFMVTADEADIAVVFSEQPGGLVDVSIRATPPYDVSQVALSLGGGGHAQAAGCTLPGPLAEARGQVLDRLQDAWREQQLQRGA